jgi:hypothetical protein
MSVAKARRATVQASGSVNHDPSYGAVSYAQQEWAF